MPSTAAGCRGGYKDEFNRSRMLTRSIFLCMPSTLFKNVIMYKKEVRSKGMEEKAYLDNVMLGQRSQSQQEARIT